MYELFRVKSGKRELEDLRVINEKITDAPVLKQHIRVEI